jgi:hypothetical protein
MKNITISAQPRPQFLETLRSSGYDNYQAISDIIDNSIDTEVGSQNVQINFLHDKKDYTQIQIIDDGYGMNLQVIQEALKLGAVTGKNREEDLGSYGTGLKSASLSLGRKFKVFTKAQNSEFITVTYDLDEILASDSFDLNVELDNKEDYENFSKLVKNETGTIIQIEKLDKISNKNPKQFHDLVVKHLSVTFGLFISEKNVNFFVNGEKLLAIDPMYRMLRTTKKLSGLDEFILYKDKKIKFNVFYLGKKDKDTLEFTRNSYNAGLWIYRNNRLVGYGLDLGIISKHGDGYLNGLRIEMYIDGSLDSDFGSTFLKLITEKTKGTMNQSLVDSCKKSLGSYITTVRNMDKQPNSDENINEEQEQIINEVFKNINQNKFIDVPKKGKNEKIEDKEDKKEIKNPGRNKFSPRKREDIFSKYILKGLGQYGNIYRPMKENGIYVIEINTDHIYWEEYLKLQSEQTIGAVVKGWLAEVMALEVVEYYNNSEKEMLLNEFFAKTSEILRKLIQY